MFLITMGLRLGQTCPAVRQGLTYQPRPYRLGRDLPICSAERINRPALRGLAPGRLSPRRPVPGLRPVPALLS
jgi:hypothetical protein